MSKTDNVVNPLNQKFYYPSLDGLRFFAFLIVFFHHALFPLDTENIILKPILIAIKKNGWVGVDLFFVLSGFLITVLLLKERQKNGQFSLKNFWIRRSLRIWPLYFLAILMGYLIIPLINQLFNLQSFPTDLYTNRLPLELPYYLTFLGNWSIVYYGYSRFPEISHLWTVSIEEQFYLLWPLLLLFIKKPKNIYITLTLIFLLSLTTRIYLTLNNIQHPGIYVNTFARIDILAIGALIGTLYIYHPHLLNKFKKICNLPLQIIALVILSYILYRVSFFSNEIFRNTVFGYWITGFFMGYFVISALFIETALAKLLSNKVLVWLGKISYGLYIWHIWAISLSNVLLKKTPLEVFIPYFGFILTILISAISYYFLERYFLKFKHYFSNITSRPV